ncbi:MAG: DNA-formamidopyrimidine glycosylase family protein [Myxococcota bacterium]
MPEGDSIFKVAARLRPHLVGKPLSRLELREHGPIPSMTGKQVERIEAHGKHMFVYVQPRRVLHVHLGMKGRWRAFPGGAGRTFPRSTAVAILGVGPDAFVCFKAAFARLVRVEDPRLRRVLEQLGPDILADDFDLQRAIRRSMARPEFTVAEVITDQRVVAGIGNVYKSEVLFLCGIHPHTPSSAITPEEWQAIYICAAELMRANTIPGWRSSTARHKAARHPEGVERYWVYRRRAAPCLRCKTPIERSELGDLARSTYWCPSCQPGTRLLSGA